MEKISKYSHIFKIGEKNLIFAGLTNAFAEISSDLKNKLENNDINLLNKQEIEKLKQIKFIASVEDENAFFNRKKFIYYNNNFNSTDLSLAIVPTSNCNFSCFYCFEENKTTKIMTDKTVDDIISFISSFENTKYLTITWYGGEPLIAFQVIKKIIFKIKKELPKIKISHSIVTNGYLLTQEKIDFFTKFPLASMQITLDGLKEKHNNIRFTKTNNNTYDKILDNLDAFFKINKITTVVIRVNIDKNNEKDYFKLHNELKERFKGNKLEVYSAFIENYTDMLNCDLLERKEQIEFVINNYKKTGSKKDIDIKLQVGGCGATNSKYFIIGSEGELYKCWNDVGNTKHIVGHINSSVITNPIIFHRYVSGETMFDSEKCKECSIFPICSGGCQWKRNANIYNNANYDLCDIKKDALNDFLEIIYNETKSNIKINLLNLSK